MIIQHYRLSNHEIAVWLIGKRRKILGRRAVSSVGILVRAISRRSCSIITQSPTSVNIFVIVFNVLGVFGLLWHSSDFSLEPEICGIYFDKECRIPAMTRSDFISALASRFPQLTVKDTHFAVNEIITSISSSLAQGRRVEIRGFGSFDLKYRPARSGRNPQTGESVSVTAKFVPHFKAGKEMRERIDLSGNY